MSIIKRVRLSLKKKKKEKKPSMWSVGDSLKTQWLKKSKEKDEKNIEHTNMRCKKESMSAKIVSKHWIRVLRKMKCA